MHFYVLIDKFVIVSYTSLFQENLHKTVFDLYYCENTIICDIVI